MFNWFRALVDILKRTRAVPRLITLPDAPGEVLANSIPLVLLIVTVASALHNPQQIEMINLALAVGTATAIGVVTAWVVTRVPGIIETETRIRLYRWTFMLIAIFVGALALFLADVTLGYGIGGNAVIYTVSAALMPGSTELFDTARLLQFLIYALIAWGFYAVFFRSALPIPPPSRTEQIVAGAAAAASVALVCAVLLRFGFELVVRWIDRFTGLF